MNEKSYFMPNNIIELDKYKSDQALKIILE